MCLPLLAAIPVALSTIATAIGPTGAALISTGVAAASAGAGYVAQQQQASAQNHMAVAIANSANTSYLAQTANINARMLQERDAALQQNFNTQIQSMQLRGRAKAQSAEAGVAGVGLNEILNDINAQEGRTNSAIAYNYRSAQTNAYSSEQNAYYQAKDRTNSLPFGVTPSLLMPILSTAGAGLGAGAQFGLFRTTGIDSSSALPNVPLAQQDT